MKVLITVATAGELGEVPLILGITEKLIQGSIVAYTTNNTKFYFLITGVGMVPTTFFLAKTVAAERFDLAINAGIAGCFTRKIPIGTVVNVVEDTFSEIGSLDEAGFTNLEKLGIDDLNKAPFEKGWLVNDNYPSFQSLKTLLPVKGITVNTITGTNQQAELLAGKFDATVETMEGAAFFYTTIQEDVPRIQLRAVSNYTGLRSEGEWNYKLAVKSLESILLQSIDEISTTGL